MVLPSVKCASGAIRGGGVIIEYIGGSAVGPVAPPPVQPVITAASDTVKIFLINLKRLRFMDMSPFRFDFHNIGQGYNPYPAIIIIPFMNKFVNKEKDN
jgi:hypothetical protein